jgi:hypothetical protein
MKKMLLSSMLVITFSSILFAQNKITNPQVLQPQQPADPVTLSIISDITVYEQPGYRGRSGNFMMRGGRLESPFPVSNISFTVPVGKIVYIKKCDGFPSENAYTASQTAINLTGICGIRSDVLTTIAVQFNGISTIIHNNDCKRVFGNIKIKIIETSPDRDAAMSDMILSPTPYMGENSFTFLPFDNENANTSPRYRYGYDNYVRNETGLRPSTVPIVSSSTVGNAAGIFKAGRNALRDGRVRIVVTTNLGSAHKTCDLCTDFSSNIRMRAPVTEVLPINHSDGRIINATHNKLILGPYEASGLPEHTIEASGGIGKNFKVYLTLVGL